MSEIEQIIEEMKVHAEEIHSVYLQLKIERLKELLEEFKEQ